MNRILLFIALMMSPGFALAANGVSLTSEVFLEKAVVGSDGRPAILLDQPKLVTPGDNLVFVLRYENKSAAPATNVSVTNPLPAAVSFREAPGRLALYSVDGGHNWGTLSALKVRERDGRFRAARPDDVTHVRWTFRQPLPAGASGKLTFRGTVR